MIFAKITPIFTNMNKGSDNYFYEDYNQQVYLRRKHK